MILITNCLLNPKARHTKALKDKYTNIKTIMRRHLHAERANRRAGKEWNRSESTTEPQPRRSEPMIELERLIINSIHTTAPLCDDDDDPCYEPPDIPMPFHIADPLNMVPAPSDDFNILRPENVLRLAEHIKLEAEYSDDNSGETVTGNTGGGATSSSSNHHDHQAAASSSDHSSSTPHWDQYKSPGTHLKRPLDGLSGGTENGSAAPLLQLKRKLLERELAMREEEHEKRMELIALQRTELQIKLQITTLAYEELLAKRSGSFSADK